MLRNRLMTGLALLVLLGTIVGCGGDIGQSPEEANIDLERTVEESIAVLAQPAEEAIVDLEQPAEEATTVTLQGWVTVDAYHYDEATGTYIHFYHDESSNIITTIGFDFIAKQLSGAASATDVAKWISLSNDTDNPPPATWEQLGGVSDTELDNTNGMGRTVGAYDHTLGTNTYTVEAQFNASGAGATVQQTGLQWTSDLLSNGNLMAANHFTAVTLAAGDALTVTWTLTLS